MLYTEKKQYVNPPTKPISNHKKGHSSAAALWVSAAIVLFVSLETAAIAELLRGHIILNEQSDDSAHELPPPAITPKAAAELVNQYGSAAASPAIANEIKKVERSGRAKEVSDAQSALAHGRWLPGADPNMAIMYGYVPPGMPMAVARNIYNTIPPNAHMQPMNEAAEQIAGSVNEPLEPVGYPPDLRSPNIQGANDQLVAEYMRQRFGPVYIPPFHRGHNHAPDAANQKPSITRQDKQISLIAPHYTFDPTTGSASIREMTGSTGVVQSQFSYDPYGQQTQIAGAGSTPDFGFDHYYVHQRSGLSLTATRAYSPVPGRFLNRDRAGENAGTNLFAYAKNDPVNSVDPTGLLPWYGNWGGQGWGNGRNQSEDSDWPQAGEPGFVPPIDCRDNCYYGHDRDLHNCGKIFNAAARQACRSQADHNLSHCLGGLGSGFDRFPGETAAEAALFSSASSPNNNAGTYTGAK